VEGATALLPQANVRAMKDASCARSTSQIKLVVYPVGLDGLLGPAARDLAHGTFSSENERQANWTDFSHFSP
jgi:hypothetical protein